MNLGDPEPEPGRYIYTSSKFLDHTLSPFTLLAVLVMPAVLLGMNLQSGLVEPFLLANLFLFAVPLLLGQLKPAGEKPDGAKPAGSDTING